MKRNYISINVSGVLSVFFFWLLVTPATMFGQCCNTYVITSVTASGITSVQATGPAGTFFVSCTQQGETAPPLGTSYCLNTGTGLLEHSNYQDLATFDLSGNNTRIPDCCFLSASISSVSNATCGQSNGSISISASGASSYTWSPNVSSGPTANNLAPGTYRITVTGGACNRYLSARITNTSNPPNARLSASPTNICSGESTILTASGGGTYSWSHGLGTGNSKVVSPSSTTTYSVTVTNNGCTDVASTTVTVENCMDAALRKVYAGDLDIPLMIGSNATFDIEVCNQGINNTIDSIEITDYIPSGYILNDPNWTPGTLGSSGVSASREFYPGDGFMDAGGFLSGECFTVPITLQIVQGAQADNLINYAEISYVRDTNGNTDDVDSTPDNDDTNDNNVLPGDPDDNNTLGGGPAISEDEDDHDPATVPLMDLALRKTLDGSNGTYKYGDIVRFAIQLINQGNLPAKDIELVDYIPGGFTSAGVSNPDWTGSDPKIYTTIGDTLYAGEDTIIYVDLLLVNDGVDGNYINYSEISNFSQIDGSPGIDIDSSPNDNESDDPGGMPESAADNFVDGNGTGTIGDGIDSTDEDDHDPAYVEVYDLALYKILLGDPARVIGDTIEYQICVINQGNEGAVSIGITDYIPVGYNWVGAINSGWNLDGGTDPTLVSTSIDGPLSPGDTSCVSIFLESFDPMLRTDTVWYNYAEINSFSSERGTANPVDADSEPDAISDNQNIPLPDEPEDNHVDDDGYDSDGDGILDEDDHDVARVLFTTMDLALRKTINVTTPGPFDPGDRVVFDIEVCNQTDTTDSYNIYVTDYLPDGLTVIDPMWIYDASSHSARTANDIDFLAPGECHILQIETQIDSDFTGTVLVNRAEISQMDDDDNSANGFGFDIDSTPDNIQGNDAGGTVNSPEDNHVDDDGRDSDGDGILDEDDEDPEDIVVLQPCEPNENLICDDDSNVAVLTADPGFSNYVWYEYDDVTMTKGSIVGTGQELTLRGSDIGSAGSRKCYIFEADGSDNCIVGSCCPVCISTEKCCPDGNCFGVIIIPPGSH